ncbi:adenylate/guanylate cyclase domain-containing protein [uncultured Ruegeria sp.]|uniref:adenylate/guanylate cyclase domain-containing protein n=1 Tax=uncultured Ruegeria sp. TaxID=259304 RepID=UPI00260A763B|nr:adenylate/guanylate cyclase domain-containing protein [uncultured Ruegeria sp.]
MSHEHQRKLASIMAADVVGYSRMMAIDEVRTIDAVRSLRTDLLQPIVDKHGGRVVKTMGDGFLIEFSSVVTSVQASVEIQRSLNNASHTALTDQHIVMRIGVHLGDIVVEDGDIFGDGVNVAARVEPLANPGGLCLSDEAYRQVRNKLDMDWTDGGEHDLKNIAHPVRVWHWKHGSVSSPTEPEPSLPDLPSVAVLPFDNMSSDDEQDYFADGLTEDLITDLSKISGLFVVARNSTFAFKGQAVDIPTIGRRLGVANVVEGSVRKLGERVRINVQLIDTKTGGHKWADRYDGSLSEVFELQDKVCSEVVSTLSVKLTSSETKNLTTVHTTNIEAYELFVQAKSTPYPPIPARLAAAKDLFDQVIKKAPDFAGGYAGLSWIIGFGALWGHSDPETLGARAEVLAHQAIALDPTFGWSYTVLGVALLAQRRFDEALRAAEQGLQLLPNDADAHVICGVINGMRGATAASIQAAETAFRLSPNFVNGPYLNVIAHTNFMAGNYHAALAAHEQNIARGGPVGPPAYCWAAASYCATGQTDKGRAVVDALLAGFPAFTLSDWNFLKLVETEGLRTRVQAQFKEAGVPA